MRLDTTSAGSLAEGGPSEVPATLGPQVIPEQVSPLAPPAQPLRGRRFLRSPAAPLAAIAAAVAVFSAGWPGALALDGPGIAMYVRLAVDHLQHGGSVPYWMPELWAGTPAWALAPSFQVLALVPAALLFGEDGSVKLAMLASQILGGWGAFVLARSLWPGHGRILLPLAAGTFYALHPLFLSHGALFGDQTSVTVMAITPWLAWSVRRAFQGGSRRYAVLGGLLAALAVLEQAEHAYGLALLCFFQLCIELARARRARRSQGAGQDEGGEGEGPSVRHVLTQAATVVAVGFGAIAFWLVPFVALHKWFVLSPPEMVRTVLVDGMASVLGREPGTFLERASPIQGAVTFDRDLLGGNFYLSWALLVPTFVAAAFLARRDEDGHLTAVLLTGGVGVWLSSAGVPLAESGPAQRGNFLAFLAIGGVTGMLVGSFLRRVTSGRAAVVSGAAALLLLLTVPYLTPFLALQRVIPLLSSIRFPRFYPVAALSLALGAAFALRLLRDALTARWPHRALPVSATAAALLVGAFLVDIAPYRSFYRVRPPEDDGAYAQAAETLRAVGSDFRVATGKFGDPRLIDSLLGAGQDLSVGWPHPIAGRQLWRLTGETIITPPGYREAALALSATAYFATEQVEDAGRPTERVTHVRLDRNPRAMPLVRAYRSALLVQDSSVAPELAVSLAPRNIGLVTGGEQVAAALTPLGPGRLETIAAAEVCDGTPHGPPPVAHEVAMACGMHPWIGVLGGFEFPAVAADVGAVFRSPADGLEGIGVWLDRAPLGAELSLRELLADGRLGREVAHAAPSSLAPDATGLYAFRFDPVEGSAAKDYAFLLACPRCKPGDEPRMVVSTTPRGPGNFTRGGHLRTDAAAAFVPLYAGHPAADAPTTRLEARRNGPGRWDIHVSGDESALVVVNDAYFPGWQARVDGKRTPVVQADGAFLGIAVGPGDHRIELSYTVPPAAVLGRLITAGTFLALLLAVPLSRRRRARTAVPAQTVGPLTT
ncbi:MAG: YfhO family protein, partial [Actinomycetota bacterium]|nr:YfhO family protein [Actinomycetota bacterium]